MNKLKTGHRVRAKDLEETNWCYGYYAAKTPHTDGDIYHISEDDYNGVMPYNICELDPDAKEFLPGDIVKHPAMDKLGIYVGRNTDGTHIVEKENGKNSTWTQCRYPNPEEAPNRSAILTIGDKKYVLVEVE